MYSFLSKYGQLIALGVGLLFTLLFFGIVMSNMALIDEAPLEGRGRIEANQFLSQTSIFDVGLYAIYILVVAAVLAILLFGILDVVKDPKGSVKGLAGIGALVLMFVVGYFMSQGGDGDGVLAAINKFNGMIEVDPAGGDIKDSFSYLDSGKSSLIGGGLMMTFILAGIAFVGLVASEVMNLFR